jgi:Ca-activated chloride channel family protein
MKSVARFVMYFAAVLSFLFGTTAYSQPKESEDRTLSPYFFVKSDDPKVDTLPLKATSASVNISGVIADVQVTQIYKNEGLRPLEAIYVFPASTKAAVYGMKMTIGERVIHARISKREDARREYEQAREQGRSASLLEQQRPNVFQMNVANIMPGDEIKVELSYTELLVPTDKVYEFVYPTVVGPRYSNQPSETTSPSQRWMQNPYLHQGEVPTYTYDITVGLAAGLPIKELVCPSHKVAAAFENPAAAMITLDPSEHGGGNRDYILRYRLDGDQIQSGLLLHRGEHENFFLLMMQPPKRVGRGQIPGREYIFIVDVSGSMHGFPLDISKKLLKNLIGNLLPTDRFNVLLFSGGSSVLSEQSVPATAENIQRATNFIDRQQGGGGTELLPAFRRALSLQKAEGYSRTIVIATDGYVTVEEEVFDLIRRKLGEANVFAFGIGTSVNRHIIEGMARVGMGEPFVITQPDDAAAQAERFRTLIQSPVLTQIKLEFHGFETYDVEPLSLPDVLAERPVIVFGKWRGQPQGEIVLSGISGNGLHRETINVRSVSPLKRNAALRYLWARHRIALLSDYNKLRPRDERVKEVTELGLAYNLLTAYTSFVAVDSEVRNTTGESTTIKQPLPLPQGVSDYAVGKMSVGEVRAALPAQLTRRRETDALSRDQAVTPEKGSTAEAKKNITIAGLTVSEGLSKDAVLSFIQKHLREIEQCTAGSVARGNIILELTITPDGKITTVKVVSGTLNNSNAERCLLDTVKKWQFPANQGGREGTARVSLVFGAA